MNVLLACLSVHSVCCLDFIAQRIDHLQLACLLVYSVSAANAVVQNVQSGGTAQ